MALTFHVHYKSVCDGKEYRQDKSFLDMFPIITWFETWHVIVISPWAIKHYLDIFLFAEIRKPKKALGCRTSG